MRNAMIGLFLFALIPTAAYADDDRREVLRQQLEGIHQGTESRLWVVVKTSAVSHAFKLALPKSPTEAIEQRISGYSQQMLHIGTEAAAVFVSVGQAAEPCKQLLEEGAENQISACVKRMSTQIKRFNSANDRMNHRLTALFQSVRGDIENARDPAVKTYLQLLMEEANAQFKKPDGLGPAASELQQ